MFQIKAQKHAKQFLRSNVFPVLFFGAITLLLAYTNHVSGTWLLGWDSLSDEFNFKINAPRQFAGVWNEYQGLGTAGGHAHASDIPRFITLYLLSFLLPDHLLRYSYFFIALFIGSLGMFYLVSITFKSRLAGYAAALAYVFNLGTLQIFYVPFEMFNVQFMALPWQFLAFVLLISERRRKVGFLMLFLATAYGLPQAYAPVLFYAGWSMLFLFGTVLALLERNRTALISAIEGIGLVLAINLYWLLPNAYYVILHGQDVSQATINRLFSEEAFMHSTRWGTIRDWPILRGFLFGWLVYAATGTFDYLMKVWREFLANSLNQILGYAIFLFSFSGLVLGVTKRNKYIISLIPVVGIAIFMLIGQNGVFTPVWAMLRNATSIFEEGLRFPYTKFSILAQFCFSVGFGYAVLLVRRTIHKKNTFLTICMSLIIIAPILFVRPFLSGHLINPLMQVQLPKEYPEAMEYLNASPNTKRILYLPMHNLFGWQYYQWGSIGYQGAGFFWFGLKSPFITRDFDRWDRTNEQLYNEVSYAIYAQNSDLLKYLLDKYAITTVLIDRSIISPYSERSLFFNETEKLLSIMPNVKKEKEFGKLTVYSVANQDTPQDYVYAPEMVFPVTEKYGFSNVDAFGSVSMNDTIVATPVVSPTGVTYPFADDRKLSQQISAGTVFEIPAPTKDGETTVSVPTFPRNEPLPVRLTLNENTVHIKYLYPSIHDAQGMPVFSKNYSDMVTFSKPLSESLILFQNTDLPVTDVLTQALVHPGDRLVAFSKKASETISFSDSVYSAIATDCEGGSGGFGKSLDPYPGSVSLEAKDKNTCMSFTKTLSVTQPSVVRIGFTYKQTVGARAMYCLSRAGISDCENKKYARSPLASADWKAFSDYVNIEIPGEYVFTVILETDNKREAQTASFRNIMVAQYPITETIPIIPNDAAYSNDQTIYESRLSASQFPLRVELPMYAEVSKTYGAGSPYFASEKRNCDQFNNKAFDRVLQDGTDGRLAFSYSATDAISCDSIDTRSIDPLASYAITFKSTHYEGKGLDICVAATNLDKCLIQDRLKGGMESFILPAYPSVEQVRVSIGNQSIGRVVSRNDLSFVTAQYIPYLWLKGMSFAPQGKNLAQNPLNISKVDKKAIYKYEIDTAISPLSSPEQKGYLVLNQSYEKGWVLYDRTSCWFGLTTPLTCTKAESIHTTAKNWANAWVVPPIASSYVIIFWPQYLQFFGYALLGVLLLGMSAWWVRSRKV